MCYTHGNHQNIHLLTNIFCMGDINMETKIKTCTFCIMDTLGDDRIEFDSNGVCSYCRDARKEINHIYFPNEEGKIKLDEIISSIKSDGVNKQYDCIMGISGGIDSSYLLYLGHKWGLRILAVHIDDGFDTEISKSNIEKLVKACNVTLHTISPDKEQFIELTKAFMRSGIPNIAAPQDNCLFTEIYKLALKYRIKYFLSGVNFATESVSQKSSLTVYDMVLLNDINKKFGTKPIDKMNFSNDRQIIKFRKSSKIVTVRPLDLIDYNKDRAFNELHDFCGFEYYGSKHLENTLTAFIQLRWFAEKFKIDKRKWHLSSLIVSNQMSRDQAIAELQDPLCDKTLLNSITTETARILETDVAELEKLLKSSNHIYSDYKYSTYYARYIKRRQLLSKLYHKVVGK